MSKQIRSAINTSRKYLGILALGSAAVAPMLYQVALIAQSH
jgi:hypothetical protein